MDERQQSSGLRLATNQFDEGRSIQVEDRHSAFAAYLIKGAAQGIWLSLEVEWHWTAAVNRALQPAVSDEPGQCAALRWRWTQLGHRPVVIGHQQTLTA